jgi:5-methylcytosine-specific restriction endonuclease McrA
MASKAYRDAHKEEIKAYQQSYRATHKDRAATLLKKYRQEHPEWLASRQAAHYLAHKKQMDAHSAVYYQTHKEECRAYRAGWAVANRERKAALDAAWQKAHPERKAAYQVTRRARKAGSPTIGKVDRGQVFERDRGICHICKLVVDPKHWHMDHIVPLSKGGAHVMANVAVSHQRCNDSKGAKLVW